jgi:hypothetical protein
MPFEAEIKLWPSVSRPVCLGYGPSLGAHDHIFLFFS